MRERASLMCCSWLLALSAQAAEAVPPAPWTLDNGTIHLEVTDAFGGRVLAFGLAGAPNLIKTGEAVHRQPNPAVTPQAGDIPYLGHDVWLGPQSQWWLHQQVNPERRAAAANWPPDPYLSLASTRVLRREPNLLELESPDSPVTGVRLRKRFSAVPGSPDTVEVSVEARNIRTQAIAWDLWFNTRVPADTRVFVPVAQASDIDLQAASEPGIDAPRPAWRDGLFELTTERGDSERPQRGKYRLQPSAGWMAGFAHGQLLLLRFEHQPRERIHPEQGQVELYLDASPDAPEQGLLEMEVHAPYRRLAPDERMQASEYWTVLRYDGPDAPAAQRRFLCEQGRRLGLPQACGP